jgi:hypothetical protein
MVKRLLQSQVSGRREGDAEEKWEYDWKKIAVAAVSLIVIPWLIWVTSSCNQANHNKETLDLQITVLHNRITELNRNHVDDDKAIRMWMTDEIVALQRDIYKNEEAKGR